MIKAQNQVRELQHALEDARDRIDDKVREATKVLEVDKIQLQRKAEQIKSELLDKEDELAKLKRRLDNETTALQQQIINLTGQLSTLQQVRPTLSLHGGNAHTWVRCRKRAISTRSCARPRSHWRRRARRTLRRARR